MLCEFFSLKVNLFNSTLDCNYKIVHFYPKKAIVNFLLLNQPLLIFYSKKKYLSKWPFMTTLLIDSLFFQPEYFLKNSFPQKRLIRYVAQRIVLISIFFSFFHRFRSSFFVETLLAARWSWSVDDLRKIWLFIALFRVVKWMVPSRWEWFPHLLVIMCIELGELWWRLLLTQVTQNWIFRTFWQLIIISRDNILTF